MVFCGQKGYVILTHFFRVQRYAVVHSIVITIICIYYIIIEIETFLLSERGFLPQCVVNEVSSKLFHIFHDENGPVKTGPEQE